MTSNGGLVIRGLSPVISVFFEKRKTSPWSNQRRGFQPPLIYKNERLMRRNELCNFLRHLKDAMPGGICSSTLRNRGESIVCKLENLRVTADLRHRAAVLVQRAYRSIIANLLYLRVVGTYSLKLELHRLADVLHKIVFGERRPDFIAQQRRRRNQDAG